MYTTLTRAKKYLDITINDYDDIITFFINSSTDLIKNYIGRNIEYRTLDYSTTGNNKNKISTKVFPLKIINTITVNGTDVTSECSIDTDSKLFIYREDGFPIKYANSFLSIDSTSTINEPVRNIEINVTGGYTLPDVGGSDFPYDIQEVCLELTKNYFTNSSIEKAIDSESYSTNSYNFSKNYRDEVKDIILTDNQKYILSKYKEMV